MGRKQSRAPKRKLALVFGENENDTKSLAILLRQLWAGNGWHVEARKKPPVLVKDANVANIPSRVAKIVALVRAAAITADVVAIVAHEDCDAVEPAHVALEEKILAAFQSVNIAVVPAAPAWEMETWLMQWPDVFPKVVESWPVLEKYRHKNVGLIANAKEDLGHAVQSTGSKRAYRESDSPALIEVVVDEGLMSSPAARSASYKSFISAAEKITGESVAAD